MPTFIILRGNLCTSKGDLRNLLEVIFERKSCNCRSVSLNGLILPVLPFALFHVPPPSEFPITVLLFPSSQVIFLSLPYMSSFSKSPGLRVVVKYWYFFSWQPHFFCSFPHTFTPYWISFLLFVGKAEKQKDLIIAGSHIRTWTKICIFWCTQLFYH